MRDQPPKYRFWPERRQGPVDDAYVQQRWMRPYRPGPLRVAASLLLLGALGLVLQVALLTTFRAPSALDVAIRAVSAVVLLAVLAVGFSRCFLSGVWVSDHRVRVLRPLSTRVWSWAEVADVRSVAGPTRLLGGPIAISGLVVVLVLRDGTDVVTPVSSRSPDFLARPEAYDMAATALEGWWQANIRRA